MCDGETIFFSIDQFQHVLDLPVHLGLAVTLSKLLFDVLQKPALIRVASHLQSSCAMF